MPYTATIANFFQVVAPKGTTPVWQNVGFMQSQFVQDTTVSGTLTYPNVGLTTGGPQFTGQKPIGTLFTELFNCFPGIVFAPANGLQLSDGNTIAVEAILSTGTQAKDWAPGGNKSPPLSNVTHNNTNTTQLPVCAVFMFDPNSSLIQNLALYFDRWKLSYDLWDKAKPKHIDT
jgi:hypothetical protein